MPRLPEHKDGHEDDDDGDGIANTHMGEELVDPVTRRVGHAARSFSPSKLEPLCDLSLGVG